MKKEMEEARIHFTMSEAAIAEHKTMKFEGLAEWMVEAEKALEEAAAVGAELDTAGNAYIASLTAKFLEIKERADFTEFAELAKDKAGELITAYRDKKKNASAQAQAMKKMTQKVSQELRKLDQAGDFQWDAKSKEKQSLSSR